MGRVIRANYGIYKKWRGGGCSENRKLELHDISDNATDDEIHEAVKNKIRELNPGWNVMGWAIVYDSSRSK